jgi:hypothetical protein
LLIKRIDIEDADVLYRSPTASVSLTGVTAVLHPDLVTRHVKADVTAPTGTVTIGTRTSPLGKTHLRIVAEGRRVTVSEFSVDGAGISVAVQGTLAFDETPVLDLSATGSIDLQPLLEAWGQSQPLEGRVTARARVNGPVAQPTVRGDLTAKAVTYHGVGVDDLSASFDAHDGRLTLTDVTGRALGGTIRGHGSVDFGVAPVTWSVDADTSRLRPAALLQRFISWAAPVPAHEISRRSSPRPRACRRRVDGQGRLGLEMTRPESESAAPATIGRVHALSVGRLRGHPGYHAAPGPRCRLHHHRDRASVRDRPVTAAGEADLTLDASGQDAAVAGASGAPPRANQGVCG